MNFARQQMNSMLPQQGGVPAPAPVGLPVALNGGMAQGTPGVPPAPLPVPAPAPSPSPSPPMMEAILAALMGTQPMMPSTPGVSSPLGSWPLNPGEAEALQASSSKAKQPKPEKTFRKKPSSTPNRQAVDKKKGDKK